MKTRDIYLLDPKQLSPEVIAVTFAKTSRSPESFREIAAGLTDEKSAELRDTGVLGYGNTSASEQGVLNPATGQRFRDEVLAVGGSRPAMESFVAFRGRKPTIDALLRHHGMVN